MRRPAGLVSAADDADVARSVRRSDSPQVRIVHGDLARTLGADPLESRSLGDEESWVLELPLDLVEVTSDVGDFVACAHVVARPPWSRGGWWFGRVTAVMNAEFLGDWDVAPRGHPNDGRVEVLQADPEMSVRQRLAVRRRLRSGTHVPHPLIATRTVKDASFEFDTPMTLLVDGVSVGRCRRLSVRVCPDAVIAYV